LSEGSAVSRNRPQLRDVRPPRVQVGQSRLPARQGCQAGLESLPSREETLFASCALRLVTQVRESRVLSVERQSGCDERLSKDRIVRLQRLTDLVRKRAGQTRIPQQAIRRIDAADRLERGADVLRPLRRDEQPALQVIVEQIALPLDLVVLARQQPI